MAEPASVTKRKAEDDETASSKKSKGAAEDFCQVYDGLLILDLFQAVDGY
jgi:hypothetical protein